MMCLMSFCLLLGLSNSIYAADSCDAMDSIVEHGLSLAKEYRDGKRLLKPIISVAGGSKAGKTYFSRVLLNRLVACGVTTQIVQLDSFLSDAPLGYILEPSEFNSRAGHPVYSFDHRIAHQVLRAIVDRGSVIDIPLCDFKAQRTWIARDFSQTDLVIVEGIYALTGKDTYNLSQYSSLKIFLDAERERLFSWYCAKKRSAGINPDEDPMTKWDFEEDYDKVIAPTISNADILLKQDENRYYIVG